MTEQHNAELAVLRNAATQIRTDCPIPERSRQFDFIDYPTGFAIQRIGVEHVESCSAAQTSGAMICDCEAIYPAWGRWKALLALADWLEQAADNAEHGLGGNAELRHALTASRAYPHNTR